MSCSLLHFENMVPIEDLKLRNDQKRRLLRVSHVYWQWSKNPFTCDYKAMLRQLVKQMGGFQGASTECRAWQKDVQLFEFVKESISPMSRREAQLKVQVAAEKAIRIGMDTDNVQALTKGGKLLYEVAGLDKPEEERIDMGKMAFLPPVVTTSVKEVDETKEDVDDQEMKRIMSKYGGFVDEKEGDIEKMVAQMKARSGTPQSEDTTEKEDVMPSDLTPAEKILGNGFRRALNTDPDKDYELDYELDGEV